MYVLNSGNKVDIDYKDNAKVSKIWFSSWIVQESLNFLSQKELCSIFLSALKPQLTVFTDSNWNSVWLYWKGYIGYSSVLRFSFVL